MINFMTFDSFLNEYHDHDCVVVHPDASHVQWAATAGATEPTRMWIDKKNPEGYTGPHGSDSISKEDKVGNMEDQGNAETTQTELKEDPQNQNILPIKKFDQRNLKDRLEDQGNASVTDLELKI